MNKKIACIGLGNMGRALIEGFIKNSVYDIGDLLLFDRNFEKREYFSTEFGISTIDEYEEFKTQLNQAGFLYIAVKPKAMDTLLQDISAEIAEDAVIVCMSPGKKLSWYEGFFKSNQPIVRIMPNTPALIGEAMTSVSPNRSVNTSQQSELLHALSCIGKAQILDEALIDTVIGVSGSSPAYVFLFIEAMADAAVLGGMKRSDAYTFAAQAVKGAAQMVLDAQEHPGVLKDQVCSPGGTTIEAVAALERNGFRAAVMEAVTAARQKSLEMTK
jgi:pyrroline-5-carboxylate reductase